MAIEPNTKADLEKMSMGLIKLAAEDPSFHFTRDEAGIFVENKHITNVQSSFSLLSSSVSPSSSPFSPFVRL